jgi:hypothetical protein
MKKLIIVLIVLSMLVVLGAAAVPVSAGANDPNPGPPGWTHVPNGNGGSPADPAHGGGGPPEDP